MLIDKVLKLSNNFNIVYFSIFNYLSIFNINFRKRVKYESN